MQVKKQQLEPDMEQWTGSNLGKEYVKAVCCHPAYLTYMQSTSWEMLDWMKHKLDSRLPGEISNLRYADDNNSRKWRGTKKPLMKVNEEDGKAGLKLHIQKTKIMASSPMMPWQMGKKWKQWQTSFSWTPKSMQMVTAAMKLKDACSLEEKLWQT